MIVFIVLNLVVYIMKKFGFFVVVLLLLLMAVGMAGCVTDQEETAEPTTPMTTLTAQAAWEDADDMSQINLRVTGTADLPDGAVVIVEAYDNYVIQSSLDIYDQPIIKSDGATVTFTKDGIYNTREAIISNGTYETVFLGIGRDVLKGESIRVRTLYQGSVSNEINQVKTKGSFD